MPQKLRIFGIGIVLFALFMCSVAVPTVKGTQDDSNKKEVGAIWCEKYKNDNLPSSDLDAHGKKILGLWKNGFYGEMENRGWGRADLEWIIFSSCLTLNITTYSNWTDNRATGLHILNGYSTVAWQYGYWNMGDCWSRGKRYAIYLFDTGTTADGHLKRAVGFAWQRATWDDAHDWWNDKHYEMRR